jgi:hypothetical protein
VKKLTEKYDEDFEESDDVEWLRNCIAELKHKIKYCH